MNVCFDHTLEIIGETKNIELHKKKKVMEFFIKESN